MSTHEAAQILLGMSAGVAVIFAALASSTASIRAGEMWEAQNRLGATAMASVAGVSGVLALAGIVLGLAWVVLSSPLAG
ncbi:MAG: hypothetical protein M3Y34_06900 [Actinomycetota bacterium]|nr:hypothetical protein [Actinomycetota bacterium]